MILWMSVALAAPDLTGFYKISTDPNSVKTAQESALSQALSEFSSLLRPVAERALRPTLFYCSEYRITTNPSDFSLQCDTKTPIARRYDGGPLQMTWDGGTVTSEVDATSAELTLKLSTSNGARVSHFWPTATGLKLKVEVVSSYLSQPMSWVIEYARQ